MTIHREHPFADPEGSRDPARRLRARLGAAVTLWTAGPAQSRAGLTVSSVMVAAGEPPRVLALIDPDSDLHAALTGTGRGVVQLLGWGDRDLAEAFAGRMPAPGGPFRLAVFVDTPAGPRLEGARTWAEVRVESVRAVGWSSLVTAVLEAVTLGEDVEPLLHRRGRYLRPG